MLLEELDQQMMSPREQEVTVHSDDVHLKLADLEAVDKNLPVLSLTLENVQRHEEYQRFERHMYLHATELYVCID